MKRFNVDTANGAIRFQADSKRYVINLKFMNASDYATSVKNVDLYVKDGCKIYDLSDRQANAPSKGIYIRNGKKFVVK